MSVEEAYQCALKAEENLNKRHEQRRRGRGGRFQRGRTFIGGRGSFVDQNKDKEVSKNDNLYHRDDGNSYQRGGYGGYQNEGYRKDDRAQEKRVFKGTCFTCGGEGHRVFECN